MIPNFMGRTYLADRSGRPATQAVGGACLTCVPRGRSGSPGGQGVTWSGRGNVVVSTVEASAMTLHDRLAEVPRGAAATPLLVLFGLNFVDELDQILFGIAKPELSED